MKKELRKRNTLKKALQQTLLYSTGIVAIVLMARFTYHTAARPRIHLNPDLDLRIAEVIFRDYESHCYTDDESCDLSETWFSFPSTVWQPNDSLKKLPVEWLVDVEEFETSDSVTYGFKNTAGWKFYYMSWGGPTSRVRENFFIHKEGKVDTLPFGGFGCATGILLMPLESKEGAIESQTNPLLTHLFYDVDEAVKSDSFLIHFKSFYGDSVGIQFSLATYSLPWSIYEPQMIQSDVYMLSTNKMIEAWKAEYPDAILPESM